MRSSFEGSFDDIIVAQTQLPLRARAAVQLLATVVSTIKGFSRHVKQ